MQQISGGSASWIFLCRLFCNLRLLRYMYYDDNISLRFTNSSEAIVSVSVKNRKCFLAAVSVLIVTTVMKIISIQGQKILKRICFRISWKSERTTFLVRHLYLPNQRIASKVTLICLRFVNYALTIDCCICRTYYTHYLYN